MPCIASQRSLLKLHPKGTAFIQRVSRIRNEQVELVGISMFLPNLALLRVLGMAPSVTHYSSRAALGFYLLHGPRIQPNRLFGTVQMGCPGGILGKRTPGSVKQRIFAATYSFFEPVPNLPLNLWFD